MPRRPNPELHTRSAVPEQRGPDAAYRAFAAQAALLRLERVTREIDGVRQATDIEYVHRMRVASRRLRTALRLFEECFPRRYFRRWQDEVRATTCALGQARDLDVQMEFAGDFERRCHDAAVRPGVRRLLLRLGQKRARAQRRVLRRLTDFQASGVNESMTAVLSPFVAQAHGPVPSPGLLEDAKAWTCRGVDELLAYESYVTQPRAVVELHAMRIAAKHLRYLMEIVEPFFAATTVVSKPVPDIPGRLRASLEAAKQVQSLLGTLHDCDVWLELLPRFMEKESKRSHVFHGHERAFRRFVPGIERFRRSVVRLRGRTYHRFAAFWAEARSKHVWESLLSAMRSEQ